MQLPDGSILMHEHAPYDPQKAHAYYLRTYKAHPRKKGTHFTVQTANGKTVSYTPAELAKQKTYAAHRVSEIQTRLHKLNSELRTRLAAARKREADSKKKPTAADKAKAAKESKQYRDSHKQELANKAKANEAKTIRSGSSGSSKSKTETTDDIKKEIVSARSDLKAAIARQRSLATAKKNG